MTICFGVDWLRVWLDDGSFLLLTLVISSLLFPRWDASSFAGWCEVRVLKRAPPIMTYAQLLPRHHGRRRLSSSTTVAATASCAANRARNGYGTEAKCLDMWESVYVDTCAIFLYSLLQNAKHNFAETSRIRNTNSTALRLRNIL